MNLRTLLFIALALLSACSGKKVNIAGNALSRELTITDYEIISLALDNFFESRDPVLGSPIINKHEYYKLLITSDSTIEDPRPYYGYVSPPHEITDSAGNPVKCRLKYKLDCSRISAFKLRTMTEQERKDSYGSWEKFYKAIPDAYGIIYVARPSYYDNKQRSSIYIEFYKQVLWAQGLHLIFKYENGKWIFHKREQGWEE